MTVVILEGRVVVDSPCGKYYIQLPLPQYGVKELLEDLPESGKSNMYYFLVKVLKLPDSAGTTRMVNALSNYGATPEMLCLADLEKLSAYVDDFGDTSRKILEFAIWKYKRRK